MEEKTTKLLSPNIFRPKAVDTNKRDRPLSSFLDSPTPEVSHVLQQSQNRLRSAPVNEPHENLTSPLVNRRPFRNLSNLVSFGSMKKKLTFSLKKSEPVECTPKKTVADVEEVESPIQNRFNKSLRRIHSMYQTPKEKQSFVVKSNNSLLAESNIEFFTVENDHVPRIDQHALHKLTNNQYNHKFKNVIIVDCRFDYEFTGGHIKNAINISNKKDLEEKFINNTIMERTLIVFHCEFSVFRSPNMASHLRKCDRILNADNYPSLSYPDLLILEGGYKSYFSSYKSNCIPQNYIEMKDLNNKLNCDKNMSSFKRSTKLVKSKSFNHFNLETSRFNSSTTIMAHTENLKVLKRQRSACKLPQFEPQLNRASTFSYPSNGGPFNYGADNDNDSESGEIATEDDNTDELTNSFQPPTALFKSTGHSKSSSSVHSCSSSLSELSTFSSNESLDSSHSHSPLFEPNEFFDSNKTQTRPKLTLSSKTTTSNNNYKFPVLSSPSATVPSLNKSISMSGLRHLKLKPISNPKVLPLNLTTSPTISSPLSNITPIPTPLSSAFDTTISIENTSSLIDPINDTPVDFSVPYQRKVHQRQSSMFSSFGGQNINFIDIDEVDESSGSEQADDIKFNQKEDTRILR